MNIYSNSTPLNLSQEDRRKYLLLKQINTLNILREKNAISQEQFDICYHGLVSKMEIAEDELHSWLLNVGR